MATEIEMILLNDVSVIEGDDDKRYAVFTIHRTIDSWPLSVGYKTIDGSAVAGQDYVFADGILDFDIGVSDATFSVEIIGDMNVEPTESFFVNLYNPQDPNSIFDQGVGTIIDDDFGTPIVGTKYDDKLKGSAESDIIKGKGGNDTINGKDGVDIAQFKGRVDDYIIKTKGNDNSKAIIQDTVAGRDGTDSTRNVEYLQFKDGVVDASNGAVVLQGLHDVYSVDEDNVLTVDAVSGVLANDVDADGDPLDAVLVKGPSNGSLSLNSDGSFTYTPNTDFFGVDHFTYKLSDGTFSVGPIRVKINVSPVNDPPVVTDDGYTINEDETLDTTGLQLPSIPGVLDNDVDKDSGALTASVISGPSHGTLTQFDADGNFIYVPDADFHGTDSFTYEADDGDGGTATGTATIKILPVNDPPVAVNDSYNTTEGGAFTANLLTNDTDIDGDALVVSAIEGGTVGVSFLVTSVGGRQASLVVDADGKFGFDTIGNFETLGAGEADQVKLTYTISDGNGGSDTATLNIAIQGENDPPVVTDDGYTINEDETLDTTGLQLPSIPGVLDNDVDKDSGALTASVISGPSHGTLTQFDADGNFIYVPDADFHGTDSFTYEADDGDGGTATGKATIKVLPVNDAPVAVNDSYNTTEGGAVTANLLTNDTDIDGDALVVSAIEGGTVGVSFLVTSVGGRQASLVVDADGKIGFDTIGNFETLGAGEADQVKLTYTISDGNGGSDTATLNIAIQGENDPPVVTDDGYTINEDETLDTTGLQLPSIPGVLDNDVDKDSGALTASVISGPSHGTLTQFDADGNFIYVPDADFHGTDSFTYEADDGDGGTATGKATIKVLPVNDSTPTVFGWDVSGRNGDRRRITGDTVLG